MNEEQMQKTDMTGEIAAEEEKHSEEEAAKEARIQAEERIRELEEELRRTKEESALRERRLRCIRQLQKRGIREEMAELIVPQPDAEFTEEEMLRRVELLADAVEEAAVRELRARASSMMPRSGSETLLTGAFIRETPVARLAEMMGK